MGLLDQAVKATRSAAAIGSLSTGFAAGAAIAVANRSRRDGANVAVGLSSQLALASAGIHLNIQGEENAFSHRPAVFLFNHQSELDVFIVAGVLRKDFAAVAKKSLQTNPVFGPIAALAGVTFIDRANSEQARAALEPVVDSLRDGVSVALAPEGTRSSDLGTFKKGAFHMAIQGGVPVVPIVIRNAAELMPPRSYLINSGTVDVVVLPPIDTSDWVPENVDEYRDEVWQMYRDTLDDWPEPDDAD